MVIDTGPKFCVVPSATQYMTLRLRSPTLIFMLKFCVKVFTVSAFANHLIDLIHVWHSDRNLSKSLHGAIPTPGYGLIMSRSQT